MSTILARCTNPWVTGVILLALCFVTYREALVGVPESDQHYFVRERGNYTSDSDFFWGSLSYSRTRKVRPGAGQFIFRPLTMAVLALEDILVQDNLYLIGCLSVIWHWLTSWGLFWIARTCVPPILALAISAFFAVQYSGIELILWHHFSAYAMAVLTLGLGIWTATLAKWGSDKSRAWIAGILFLLSGLFHEVGGMALVLMGAVVLWLKKTSPAEQAVQYPSLKLFVIPAIVFWWVDIADILAHAPRLSFTTSIHATDQSFLSILFSTYGIFLTAFLLPFSVQLSLTDPSVEKRNWEYIENVHAEFVVLGIVAMAAIAAYGWYCAKKCKTDGPAHTLPALLSLIYVGFFPIALIQGRLADLGLSYLGISTYYFYFLNFVLLLLLVFSIPLLRLPQRKVYVLSAIFLTFTLIDYFRVQDRVQMTSSTEALREQEVSFVSHFLSDKPDLCFAGSFFSSQVDNYSLITALYRKSCAIRKTQPVALVLDPDKQLAMYLVPPVEKKVAVNMNLPARALAQSPEITVPNPGPEPQEGKSVLLGSNKKRVKSVGLVIHRLGIGGLIANYKSKDDFILAAIGPDKVDASITHGERVTPLMRDVVDSNAVPVEIALREMGDRVYFFKDNVIQARFDGVKALEGRIGIYDAGGNPSVLFDIPFVEE